MNFKNYAEYYDLLYKDKDYKAETNYVEDLLNKYSANKIETILDLGCGTGKHDNLFAKKAYKVTGVDLSEEMINIANENRYENTDFLKGDVRNINLNEKFDAIVSLFHVASYQTSNKDFENYLKTAFKHLKENGLFIFDFWYGPAVLTDRPVVRVKRLENDKIKITRISEPDFHPNKNIVDVNFEIQIKNKQKNETKKIIEIHNMRYWFMPEIELISQNSGFSVIKSFEWMTKNELNFNSWNGVIILKKSLNP